MSARSASGPLSPSLVKTPALLSARARARRAAATAGESIADRQGRTPVPDVRVTTHPFWLDFFRYSSSEATTFAGSWSATRRNDSLACAALGMIVLGPGPACPPHRPLTSAGGPAHIRSSVE